MSQTMAVSQGSENSPEDVGGDKRDLCAVPEGRSSNQRRRLLLAVAAGVPTIVAGSAQTAYAAGSSQYS